MKRLLLGLIAATTALTAAGGAEAQRWHGGHHRGRHHGDGRHRGPYWRHHHYGHRRRHWRHGRR